MVKELTHNFLLTYLVLLLAVITFYVVDGERFRIELVIVLAVFSVFLAFIEYAVDEGRKNRAKKGSK